MALPGIGEISFKIICGAASGGEYKRVITVKSLKAEVSSVGQSEEFISFALTKG